MFRVEISKGRFLEVDFNGILTPREEEIAALRMLGKGQEAISEITGIKPDTVNKHGKSSFGKLELKGADNPLAALTLFAFDRGFAKFAAMVLMIFSILPTPRPTSAVRTPTAQMRRANKDERGNSMIEIVQNYYNLKTNYGTV